MKNIRKKLVLSLLIAATVFQANAQEKGKIRAGLDLSISKPTNGVGIGGDFDFRYNLKDNINLSLQFGAVGIIKEILNHSYDAGTNGIITAMESSILSADYYFDKKTSNFAPFIGGGIGSFSVINKSFTTNDNSTVKIEFNDKDAENTIGAVFRGGFEYEKFRLALNIYIIPTTKLVDLNQQNMGTCKNSYINLSMGFYIGGGNWKKASKKGGARYN